MAEHGSKKTTFQPEEVLVGALAEFDRPDAFLAAASKIREAGYRDWEIYAPFPLHGMEEARGPRKTILPYVSAACACLGFTTAVLLQWWTNGVDYQFWISGKEFFAIPSSMPVIFELSVLFTAIGTFLSMFLLSNLPLLSNPLLRNERFRRRATSDGFFIVVEASDPKYARGRTVELLQSMDAVHAEDFSVASEPTALPRPFALAAVVLFLVALVPPIWILRERSTFHRETKIHPVLDMDFQPKKKTQKINRVFADDRASRPDVPGAVARGELQIDEHFYRGIDRTPASVAENAAFLQEAEAPAEPEAPRPPADQPAQPADATPWAKTFPAALAGHFGGGEQGWIRLLERGEERFNIYCATCHGLVGDGNGLISLRAMALQQPTWIKPLSLHDKSVVEQPVGKIFGTITNGIRRMPGYASQIAPQDRWAIVAYVQALQRSQSTSEDDVPPGERSSLDDPSK